MKWLKSLTNCPQGEFSYVQTEGIEHRFERTPLIGELASRIVDFRKGNSLPRASRAEAMEDVIVFTVNRLPSNSEWVVETEMSVGELLPQSSGGGCAGCGANIA